MSTTFHLCLVDDNDNEAISYEYADKEAVTARGVLMFAEFRVCKVLSCFDDGTESYEVVRGDWTLGPVRNMDE